MCGIAGSINFRLNVNKIIEDLSHRGPDENGLFEDKNIQLVHTRLAIQDIKHGSQPFLLDDFIIVFNGEIYNHLEIREKYLRDFKFKTNSDTETLLYLYKKYKENLFKFIDGMFAFAIYDKKSKRLFLARDRAGKKPLYYYYNNNILVFASELNALKNQLNLMVDKESINFFLRTGFFWKNTPFKNVYELEPGSYMEIDTNFPEIQKKIKYFDISMVYKGNYLIHTEDEAILEIEKSLRKSIHNRMISSDVEVAAFLSGGIDSSLVVALAKEYKNLQTFTVKFEGMYDESPIASKIAKHLNVSNHIIEINLDNLKENVEEILLAYGKPFFDSSAIPSYYISKEVVKHTKVVLNGDGGDELFAGYRRYVPFQWNNFVKTIKALGKLYKILPPPKNKMSLYNYIYRLLKTINKTGLSFYLSLTTDIFEDVYEDFQTGYLSYLDSYINKILREEDLDYIQKLLILDFNILLPSDLLQKMDIATMKYSLEARSPFLSIYVIDTASRIDSSLKVKGITTKYILRKLASKYIPQEITNLPKRGFEIPLVKWIDNDLNKIIKHYVFDNAKFYPEFIPRKLIRGIYDREIKLAEDKRAKILWIVFALEVWGQTL